MLSIVEAWWQSTHPDIAALVTPLSASRIEGGPAKRGPGESALRLDFNLVT